MSAPARIAAALAVLALLLLGPVGGASTPARAMGTLPPCRYDDLLTSPRGYGDWQETLVDTILSVPTTYVPPDLVPVTEAGLPGADKRIRAVAIDDLRAMADAARAAGAPIGVESAYRSYADQVTLFKDWQRNGTIVGADSTIAARPGHSEHQLGVAIDFKSAATDAPAGERFGATPGGKWMAQHAWSYGWLMSFPEDAIDLTCYANEPWHYRYVGRELAARIHASGLTVREYLWTRFTTTIVPMPLGAPFGLGGTPPPGLPLVTEVPSVSPDATTAASPVTAAPPTTDTATGSAEAATPAATSAAEPVPAGANVDAGWAVVIGAIAIIGAALAVIAGAARRTRPGLPPAARR
jgi:D-alanyl-D-alanine carboxypeptidase